MGLLSLNDDEDPILSNPPDPWAGIINPNYMTEPVFTDAQLAAIRNSPEMKNLGIDLTWLPASGNGQAAAGPGGGMDSHLATAPFSGGSSGVSPHTAALASYLNMPPDFVQDLVTQTGLPTLAHQLTPEIPGSLFASPHFDFGDWSAAMASVPASSSTPQGPSMLQGASRGTPAAYSQVPVSQGLQPMAFSTANGPASSAGDNATSSDVPAPDNQTAAAPPPSDGVSSAPTDAPQTPESANGSPQAPTNNAGPQPNLLNRPPLTFDQIEPQLQSEMQISPPQLPDSGQRTGVVSRKAPTGKYNVRTIDQFPTDATFDPAFADKLSGAIADMNAQGISPTITKDFEPLGSRNMILNNRSCPDIIQRLRYLGIKPVKRLT